MSKKKEIGIIWKIVLEPKVGIAGLLAVVSLSVILLYVLIPQWQNEVAFIVAVVGGAAFVYAACYTGASVKIKGDMEKMHHSFIILKAFVSPELTKIRLQIEEEVSAKRQDTKPVDLYQNIAKDKDLSCGVRVLLGLFEEISIGIQSDYLDEEVLYYSLGWLMPFHYDGLQDYIKELRNLDKDLSLYAEAEKMRDAWRVHKSLVTGREFPYPTKPN